MTANSKNRFVPEHWLAELSECLPPSVALSNVLLDAAAQTEQHWIIFTTHS
jgi:hypothetical protein